MFGDSILESIQDNLGPLHMKFLGKRSEPLDSRFMGWRRAVVAETNDPIQFRRVRVKIPELHNNDTKTEDLPWAIPAPWMGGTGSGSWTHPIIGDIVFVCFENNHAYAPIYCSAADPTRRRMYSLWSMYTKSPQAVDETGMPAETPTEFLKEYLPKDGRPMSTGMSDRYGNFLNFSAYGFAPKEHMVNPASAGTDALAKQQYQVGKDQPKVNDPDLKYLTLGTKYGHLAIFGDQGYKWDNEFEGDFEKDKKFEQDRYQYLTKYFNEQEAKGRDQRRIDIRTRLGHKFEMRDVGWDKSRDGEYGPIKPIGDSKDRDERWIKLRSKGGHLFQMIDVGFDAENDKFYKRLNKDEFGAEVDEEHEIDNLAAVGAPPNPQGDQRMIRLVTRHGNMLLLDDRGSDPVDSESKETPHGTGFLMRTRKGFQMQAVDKPELDHFLLTSPKDQTFEINDRSQCITLSTTQSEPVHTDANIKTHKVKPGPDAVSRANNKGATQERRKSIYVQSSAQKSKPLSNTYHLVLDKQNSMVRLKCPEGSGMEIRGTGAPCGEWVEIRDKSNRALWFSDTDNWTVLRGKKGAKWLLLDDNDDVILLRNELGKIQIRAKQSIEIISDEGDICLKAKKGQVGIDAKEVNIRTGDVTHRINSIGIASRGKVQGTEFEAKPEGKAPCTAVDKEVKRTKPEDFPNERGCERNQDQKGSVPTSVIISPPGGGGGGGGGGSSGIPPGEDNPIDRPDPDTTSPPLPPSAISTPPPDPVVDPISEAKGTDGGGVLWYGTTTRFQGEIEELGLLLESYSNNLNVFPNQEAEEFHFAKSLEVARGKTQAILAQRRYGERSLILRIRAIPEGSVLSPVEGNDDVLAFKSSLPFKTFVDVYEEGTTTLTAPPLFPNV